MAGAILEGWRSAGFPLAGATVIRPSGREVEGVRTVSSLAEAGSPPKLVLLGFKPQQLNGIAPELRRHLGARTVVLSILAGAGVSTLREHFPGAAAIIRAMPNLPVSVRRGVTALYSEDADEATRDQVGTLFAALGFAAWTSSEASFGAVGLVAGSGPAYVARFIDALAEAGIDRGLDPALSRAIALETVFGTAWLAAAGSEPMDQIARRVASPNGTTEAALAVLDTDRALERLIGSAIAAAAARGAELAAETAPAAAVDSRSTLA
jgi:pyrroline-5-carboxylate reductase